MNTSRQLYQLQEIDSEIDASEQRLAQIIYQLAANPALLKAQSELKNGQQRLEEVRKQQHSTEADIESLAARIKTNTGKLYGGRVTSPKELTDLQKDTEGLTAKRSQLENKLLEIMAQAEHIHDQVALLTAAEAQLEEAWREQQQELSTEAERVKLQLNQQQARRQQLLSQLEPPSVALYNDLKKQRGKAVARVEQGTCCGCRVSLSVTELQRVRGNHLVQCSSCRRILCLP